MITALLALGILFVAIAIPISVATRRGAFFTTDVALTFGPFVAFAISATYFRESSIMFGWLIYPIEVLIASALLLYTRVFLLDRLSANPRMNSVVCLGVACAAAFIAGLLVPVGQQ